MLTCALEVLNMGFQLFSLLLVLASTTFAGDLQSDSCLQCMRSVNATLGECKSCAQYVQQMMASSNLDHLTGLMASLKKTAYKNCDEHGLQSKACQVYHALCQDDHACDHELLSRLSELKESSETMVDTVVA